MRLFNIQHRPKGHVSRLPYYSSILPSIYHQFVFTFFIFKRSTRVIIFPRTDDTCCACLRVSLVVRSLRIFKEQSGEEKVLCLSKSRPESSCVWTLSKKFILQVIFLLSLSLSFSLLVKRKLMDCFLDGNRTILEWWWRGRRGLYIVSEQSECTMHMHKGFCVASLQTDD